MGETELPADFTWSGIDDKLSEDRFSLSDDGAMGTGRYLVIKDLKVKDAGMYKCSAVFKNGDKCPERGQTMLKVNGEYCTFGMKCGLNLET